MSDLPQEMARLLDELRQEGRLDSAGQFTLDFARGIDKLRAYQLAEAHTYLLKLVQSAVAAGATSISIQASMDTVQLSHDGVFINDSQLEGLANCLLQPDRFGAQPHLIHLATGLNSSLACDVESIVIESWDHQQGAALLLTEACQQTGRVVGARRQPGTRIYLRKRSGEGLISGLGRRFFLPFMDKRTSQMNQELWRGIFLPEVQALRERACYCPVPLYLGKTLVSHGRFGRSPLPPLLWAMQPLLKVFNKLNRAVLAPVEGAHKSSLNVKAGEDPVMPWWVLIWNVEDYVFGQCHRHHHLIERRYLEDCPHQVGLPSASTASLQESEGEGAGCGQVLALEMDLRQESRLLFVQDGVVVAEKTPVLGHSGAVGVLSACGLKTDLSHFNLVEDDAYEALLEQLKGDFAGLTQRLRDRLLGDTSLIPLGRHVLGRLPKR